MKRVFITIIAVMFLLCIPLLSFAAGKPQPPSSGAFIPPAWSQKLPAAERFVLVLDGVAVLDKETGLVWEKSPADGILEWRYAQEQCFSKDVGGRKGWRVPTLEELASLIDPTQSNLALPSGHPFIFQDARIFWTATTTNYDPNAAYAVEFGSGWILIPDKTSPLRPVWCVRGRYGYDAY